jgi:hypothetical protein
MPFEHRPNSGSLFKPKKKNDNPNAPTLTGSGLLELVDGSLIELDIAAWTKESPKAGKWLSLSIKLKGDQPIRQRFDNDGGGRQCFNRRVQEMGTDIDDAFGPQQDDSDIEF